MKEKISLDLNAIYSRLRSIIELFSSGGKAGDDKYKRLDEVLGWINDFAKVASNANEEG